MGKAPCSSLPHHPERYVVPVPLRLIHNVRHIDRGYPFIDKRLQGNGADMRRV